MIEPEEIRRKAANLYPQYLRAWLTADAFFPKTIPSDKNVDENLAAAHESIQRLKSQSKAALGFGYSIEWMERNSRIHGRNLFPQRIVFETEDDLLRYIGKRREFDTFASAVTHIRSRHPALESWITSHRQKLIEAANELEGLLHVIDYFLKNPRPGLFARELPLPVDTKFIERNSQILRDWFDLLLLPHAIRADEVHFERRYGLRYAEPLLLVRFLDEQTQLTSDSPWPECAIPLHTLANQPIAGNPIFIIENKVSLLTIPRISGASAVGGLGYGVVDLRFIPWLSERDLWYWGDIDVEGFQILSRLRLHFPHVRSLMMDNRVIEAWCSKTASNASGRSASAPANLTPLERAAFENCSTNNLRIEQEQLPQHFVVEALTTLKLLN